MSLSLSAWFVMGLVVFFVLWFIPNNPVRGFYELVSTDPSSTVASSPAYLGFESQLDTLELWVASPLSSLVGGIVLGLMMGVVYGEGKLYRWAGGCGLFVYFLCLAFLWGGKLQSQQMHFHPTDITAQSVVAQIFALVFWTGLYIGGAEVGRRLRNMRTRPATAG